MAKRRKILRIEKTEADRLKAKHLRPSVFLNDIWKPFVLLKRLTTAKLIEHHLGFSTSDVQAAKEPQKIISVNNESSSSSKSDNGVPDTPGSSADNSVLDGQNMEIDEDNLSQCSWASSNSMASNTEEVDIIEEFRINRNVDPVPVYNDCADQKHDKTEKQSVYKRDVLFINNNNNNHHHHDENNSNSAVKDDTMALHEQDDDMNSTLGSDREKFNFLASVLHDIHNKKPNGTEEASYEADKTVNQIFGNVCLPFLENKCYGIYACQNDHKLIPKEQVLRNLQLCEHKEVQYAQAEYLLKYDKLLIEYFASFTKYYGHKHYPEYLRRSIVPIAGKQNPTFLKDILAGFLIGGLKYHTAIDVILNELPQTMDDDDRFSLLWKIILDTRNKRAHEHMKLFEPVILKENNGEANEFINSLLKQLVINEFPDLKMLGIRLLKNCAITTLRRIERDPLNKFIFILFASNKIDADAISRRVLQFGLKVEW